MNDYAKIFYIFKNRNMKTLNDMKEILLVTNNIIYDESISEEIDSEENSKKYSEELYKEEIDYYTLLYI